MLYYNMPKNEINKEKINYAADTCRSSSEMTSRGGGIFPFDDDMEACLLIGVDSDSEEHVEDAVDGLECDERASADVAGDCGDRWGVEVAGSGVKEPNAAGAEAMDNDEENDDVVSGVLGRSNDNAEIDDWSALPLSISRSFPFLLRPALYAANSFNCCIFSVVSRSLMLTTREELDGDLSRLAGFRDKVTPGVM